MVEMNIHNIVKVTIGKWENKKLGDRTGYRIKKIDIITDTGDRHQINLFT